MQIKNRWGTLIKDYNIWNSLTQHAPDSRWDNCTINISANGEMLEHEGIPSCITFLLLIELLDNNMIFLFLFLWFDDVLFALKFNMICSHHEKRVIWFEHIIFVLRVCKVIDLYCLICTCNVVPRVIWFQIVVSHVFWPIYMFIYTWIPNDVSDGYIDVCNLYFVQESE
jgi:hypothetical protein